MLARRLRRRPNTKTTLGQRLVFAGKSFDTRWGRASLCRNIAIILQKATWSNILTHYKLTGSSSAAIRRAAGTDDISID